MIRQKGILTAWKDDKGFGFIRPDGGGDDVFVHIRDFGNLPRKPRVGDVILYQPLPGKDGRYRAADVQIEGVPRGSAELRPKQRQPSRATISPKAATVSKTRGRLISSALTIVTLCILGLVVYIDFNGRPNPGSPTTAQVSSSDDLIQQAFQSRKSDLQVSGSGVVVRILPDDLEGSRHQKFILRLASGQTLLVAHNIDLAPRINSLREGDSVEFNGKYEWNAQGGVLHWTHHDPGGRHEDGWLIHKGRRYQ